MRYKYYFTDLSNPNLLHWLEENEVCYYCRGRFVCFDIWSDSQKADNLLEQLKTTSVVGPIVTAHFTQSELSEASLLMISSRKQCIDIINGQEAYSRSCEWTNPYGIKKARHKKQQNWFAIAKEPSVKTQTAFWHEDTGFAELFTDVRVHDLVKQNNLEGITFHPVYLKNRACSQNIFQITSESKVDTACIEFGHGERKLGCPICGKEQFFIIQCISAASTHG